MSMKKTPLKTSLRSVIQATDSARSGWIANTAATKAAGQSRPVICQNTSNNKTAATACNSTLVK